MRYHNIDSKLFATNRKNFVKQLQPGSLAIFVSNAQPTRSADASYNWRQNPDMFYLTGVDQEDTILVLFPDAPLPEWREILYVRQTNEHIRVWEGNKLSKEQAVAVSGIKEVRWTDSFAGNLSQLMYQAQHVYLNTNENDRSGDSSETAEYKFARDTMKRYPLHTYHRAAPIMSALRMVKSPQEIALLQQAIDITAKGFRRVLGFVKPGVWEFEIEAEMTHEYIRNRSTGHAYTPIVASGENACVLHYISNDAQCKKGELILLDCGAEYANYNADLTRTIPVDGRYTKRQKEVYNAVLKIMKEARSMMREGMVLHDFNTSIGEIMEAELISLKLLSKDEVKKQDKKQPLYKKYFPHGTAHFLGLDVHDIGNRYTKLKAGTVLTCEPGIYISEEKLGIRIENNIFIGKGKPTDLMASIPIEADEIEELMNSKRK
jgi:Xaa-Pro aminopeptidase